MLPFMPLTVDDAERLPASVAPRPDRCAQTRTWRIAFGCLVVSGLVLRILYLAYLCPYDLAPDEAHYWDWSRHLDWSYYSKGPLVAYLIRASCWLAGPLSQSLLGNEMLAVRLPAAFCGSLLLVSLYVLTVQVYRSDRLAFAVAGLILTVPVFSLGASVMTIDAPYTCLWGWALVFGYQAVFRGANWAWIATGMTVGVGMLAKYTMILWLPSVAMFLLLSPTHRHWLLTRNFWLMVAVAGLCCTPILIWNLQNSWVTFRHVGGQAGLTGEKGILWLGPLNYLGLQAAILLGSWLIVWALAMWQSRPWRESDPGMHYLWWMSAPMFMIFFVFSLKTWGEPNWPITAYLSGFVLGTAWLARQTASPIVAWRRLVLASLALTCAIGMGLGLVMHHSDLVRPVLARLAGTPTAQDPLPLRRIDPTCRLRGWSELAGEVDRLRQQLRLTGEEPVIAASSWTLPGELGFYCTGHPAVYSLGLAQGDRHSQYDLWHPNPIDEDREFLGRTFVFVGDMTPVLRTAFVEVEARPQVVYHTLGQPIASWQIHICRGYLGISHIAGFVRSAERASF